MNCRTEENVQTLELFFSVFLSIEKNRKVGKCDSLEFPAFDTAKALEANLIKIRFFAYENINARVCFYKLNI